MTRRDIIKSGAGLAAILAAGKAPAALTRSMLAARPSICAGRKPLPYLKRVEWLQSTGLEYIDTGFTPNQDSGVILLCKRTGASGVGFNFFGSRVSSGSRIFTINRFAAGRLGAGYNNTVANSSGNTIADDGEWHELKLDRNVFSADGIIKITFSYASFTTPGTALLFGLNNNGTPNPAYAAISTARIYDSGELVRDFIPVIDLGGEPCMYDRVTRQNFYTSQGAFIAGPDAVSADGGGGYKLKCTRRSYTRFWRPSRRFCRRQSWKEAA